METDDVPDILSSFQMNWMIIRDEKTGNLVWNSNEDFSNPEKEHEARLPKSIFDYKSVTSEINFSSLKEMKNLKLQQKVLFKGQILEEWNFEFGYVIPGSTNTWQTAIVASPESEIMPANVLSGNVTLETAFYDDTILICKSNVRLFYV